MSLEQFKNIMSEEAGSPLGKPEILKGESGVTGWERAQIMNIAPSPESATQWLKNRGYDAYQYGDGYKIAVRNPKKDNKWKVVDPEGLDWGDFTDMGDEITSTAASIGGAVAGVPGGIAGMAGGGALGSAGAEATRRLAGQAAGFRDTSGQAATDIVIEGALGGASELLPGAGKLAKSATKGAIKKLAGEGVEQAISKGTKKGIGLAKSVVGKTMEAPQAAIKTASGKISETISAPISGISKLAKERFQKEAPKTLENLEVLIKDIGKDIGEDNLEKSVTPFIKTAKKTVKSKMSTLSEKAQAMSTIKDVVLKEMQETGVPIQSFKRELDKLSSLAKPITQQTKGSELVSGAARAAPYIAGAFNPTTLAAGAGVIGAGAIGRALQKPDIIKGLMNVVKTPTKKLLQRFVKSQDIADKTSSGALIYILSRNPEIRRNIKQLLGDNENVNEQEEDFWGDDEV